MTRKTLPALLAAVLLAPVALAGIPRCEDDNVRVEAGATVIVECFSAISGLAYPAYGEQPSFVFRSTNNSVALVEGKLRGEPRSKGKVRITGVAPGRAYVRAVTDTGGSVGQYVRIDVVEAVRYTFELVAPESARVGEQVTIAAQWNLPAEASYAWYAGRLGDISKQLPEGGPSITFAADKPGEHFVWVAATVNGVTQSAEIAIKIEQNKRRAVR